MKRYAIVRNARTRREAEAYLPDNYKLLTIDPASRESCGSCGADIGPSETFAWHEDEADCRSVEKPVFVIEGEDKAGWTLDAYVIPRYLSGLIGCEEIDLSHPIMKLVPVESR